MKRVGRFVGLALVALLVVGLVGSAWGAYKAEYKMSVRTTQTSPWGAGAREPDVRGAMRMPSCSSLSHFTA